MGYELNGNVITLRIFSVIIDLIGVLCLTKLGWISFVVLIAMDVVLRQLYQPISEITLVSLGISLAFSVFFWSFMDLTVQALSDTTGKFLAAGVSAFWVFLIGTQIPAFMRFGEYATPFMINWVIRDPKYILDYAWPLLNVGSFLSFIIIWFTFYWLWKPKLKSKCSPHRFHYVKLVLSLLMSLVSLNQLRRETLGQIRLADGALAFSIDAVLRQGKSDGYRFSRREEPIAKEGIQQLPHVFLFIGESWSKGIVPIYGWNKSNTMPFLKALAESEKMQKFLSAYTNSGATDVSIPSLFSGVGPEESTDKLHRVPLIWDWAKAAGYRTIFISPQRLAFNGIHQFFLSPGPDQFVPGDAIDFKMVNDSGIDDLKTVEFLAGKLDQIDINDKPLFIVFFHNALHFPFLTESPGLEVPNFSSRYEKALFITDVVIKRIVDMLKTHKMWDDTLFWLTADHGEVENTSNKVPRIASFYQEILGIPFLLRWPTNRKFYPLKEKCITAAKKNEEINVQNLDVLPTLIDLWDLGDVNKPLVELLRGQSLCKVIDPYRPIIHLNTNNIRKWSPEGFAVTKGKNRYSFTNIEGAKFFDLTVNPNTTEEKENTSADDQRIAPFLKIIQSDKLMRDIWNRYKQK